MSDPPCPGVMRGSPTATLLGAAHYWHGRWYRRRWWRAVALVSCALNAYLVGKLAGWL